MIANHKGEIPFVVLLIPFLPGIGLGMACPLPADWLLPLGASFALTALVFIVLNIGYKKLNIYKIRWLGGALISALLFLFGCISVITYNELNRDSHFSKHPAKYLVVNINSEPVLKNGLIRFTAKLRENVNGDKHTASSGNLLITLKDTTAKQLSYGDELLVPATYTAIDPPFNPAEFNYKQYLANQNIHYQLFLYPHQYALIAHDTGNPLVAYSLRLRRSLVAKLKLNMHNPEAIAVASTLLLGYKADLSSNVYEAYAKTGTAYVLSVSGAQVAIIYAMLSFLLGFLNRHQYGRMLKAVLIICLLSYYALLTGFSPAVCRAVLVLSLVLIGKTYNRYINSLNLLAASAFVLLLYDPFYIAAVGFQLSYIAITGLIVLRPVVYRWLYFKNKWADKLWQLISLSIAAQVITFPLSALYFHQFPVYFLLSYLLVIIPASIATYAGVLYLLLPQLPVVSPTLGLILEKTIWVMDKMLAAIQNAPFASINKIWLSTFEYLLLYAIIISLFYFLYNRKAWQLRLSLICTLLLCISITYKRIDSIRANSIAFLSLGKHSGIVFKRGDSAIVLSDLSDTDRNYKYSIQPYLDSSRVSAVNVYNMRQRIRSAYLLKQYNYIQFLGQNISIINKAYNNLRLTKPLTSSYVYVSGSPQADISYINKNYLYKTLVIDASNSPQLLKKIKTQADSLHINFVVLKRNKSLLAVSKN